MTACEGRLDDSAYVKGLAYEFYESGAFRHLAPAPCGCGPADPANGPPSLPG